MEQTNVFNVDIGKKLITITTDIEKVVLKDLAVLRKDITKTVKDANKEEKKLRADLASAESNAKNVCYIFFECLNSVQNCLFRQKLLI